jgi:hypothetical protein
MPWKGGDGRSQARLVSLISVRSLIKARSMSSSPWTSSSISQSRYPLWV